MFTARVVISQVETDATTGSSVKVLYMGISEKATHIRSKRLLDLAFSLIAIVLLFPLFSVVAFAIRFSSKGPIFFKQERVGKEGRVFTFLKFRSMYVNCDQSVHRKFIKQMMAGETDVSKLRDDPRVTPVGRILRRTSLDELPQFFNVVRGDMSIVGPRPYPCYEAANWEEWQKRRLAVTPGITGLWQVEGRGRASYNEAISMDVQYVENASLRLDAKILLKTVLAVLSLNGAH